jgi:carotene biosynthesis associated membrane protein
MRTVRFLFIGHLLALCFGLAGLRIALPNPQLWSGSPGAAWVFAGGMQYAGSLHILLGAATLFVFGLRLIGVRKTLIFFIAAVTISLSSELLGTGTGWPFGAYSYTGGLGWKIAGRVPFTIPLSWFYMGFAAYLLAQHIAGERRPWRTIALAVWLLTIWDLALDPAMAHPRLPVQFWVWHETGPYFGMPIKNFAGWSATALAFMAFSRWLWHADLDPTSYTAAIPLGVYAANMGFATVLSVSVGLWQPPLLAIVCGLLPALLVWRQPRPLVYTPAGDSRSAPAP